MTRIIVVDDHKIIRQGLIGLLRGVEEFEVVAEAGTGAAAVRFVQDIIMHKLGVKGAADLTKYAIRVGLI